MKPTLSLCMIVRNVENPIRGCLESIIPFIDELIICDTGSTDRTQEVIREVFPAVKLLEFNPETHPAAFTPDTQEEWEPYDVPGPFSKKMMLSDFGAARQFGWKEATSDYLMWLDSDDVVLNAKAIPDILSDLVETENNAALLYYDYAQDGKGRSICKLIRERIITRKVQSTWMQPVHETVGPYHKGKFYEEVTIRHRRYELQIPTEIQHRNLKIILKWWEKIKDTNADPRVLFYLACEQRYLWPERALQNFEHYTTLSGWDEERSLARLHAGKIYENQLQYNKAMQIYALACEDTPWNPDPFFSMARIAYFQREWVRCIELTEKGIEIRDDNSARKSTLMFDPSDRYYQPLPFYSVALIEKGKHAKAIEVCQEGLKWNPSDPHLKGNLEQLERIYGKSTVKNIVRTSDIHTSDIQPQSEKFTFKYDEPLDTPPVQIPPEFLVSFALLLWKYNEKDKLHVRSLQLLDSLPEQISLEPKIRSARDLTIKRMEETIDTPTEIKFPRGGKIEAPSRPLKILIWTGPAWEEWSPDSITTTGIGGSETAAVCMAYELRRLGHQVIVVGDCPNKKGFYDGVEYIHHTEITADPQGDKYACDVYVVSRQTFALNLPIRRKATYVWVHDVHVGHFEQASMVDKIDKFLCLTYWHKEFFHHAYSGKIPEEKILVTANGIDPQWYQEKPVKVGNRLIYASSPDRGLERLLQIFPKIREQVPDAELHIYYGFHNWKKMAQSSNNKADLDKIAFFEDAIAAQKDKGVTYHGRIPEPELAKEFAKAKVWAYPTAFTETYCQPPGSLIFTKNGMVPIEKIKVGDLVLTHKGRFRPVTRLIKKKYDGKLFSFKRRKDFDPIIVTPEHPLLVATFNRRSDSRTGRIFNKSLALTQWKKPGEISELTNHLVTPKMKFGILKKIKLSNYIDLPVQDGMVSTNHNHTRWVAVKDEILIEEKFMYILGIFAAEGCVIRSKNRKSKKEWRSAIVFSLHVKEKKILAKIKSFFGKVTVRITSENGCSVIVHSSPWANFLEKIIGRKRDKKIPPFVWDTSESNQKAFLQGMFDGDGCRGRGSYPRYTSISPSLTYGFAQLLTNQGVFPGIIYDKKRRAFNLGWTDPNFPKKRRVLHHNFVPEGISTRITSIEMKKYSGFVYNFDVMEDESYVTNRTIVHNCITSLMAQASECIPVTTALAALNETVSHGFLLKPPSTTNEYEGAFIRRVVMILRGESKDSEPSPEAFAQAGREFTLLNRTWKNVAQSWEKEFRTTLQRKQEHT